MIILAWYLLKVIMCSGILCGYYYVALRNNIFHRWNRFYLLASMALALMVPLMKINIFQKPDADKGTVVRMLQTITNSDEIIIEYSRNNGLQLSSENITGALYLLVTIAFLFIFSFALYKIFMLKKKYPGTKLNGINFISTDAKGTPFSFFNSIFWNNAIDLHSKQGHQIFNHEIAHVREKHSYDKVFMNVVLLFFWINPFFWLIQKELSMIHEFIADKEALEDNDINAFAEMVLQTIYPGRHFSLASNFFHSPLKRRLNMFTKNKNPKVSYVSRMLVLPLAAVVFFAFTLKMKTAGNSNYYAGKKITVVIDAGHGGSDDGVIENNIKEKDLTLAIAKEIKELNKNENLNIVLSRTGDELLTPKDRINFADAKKADVFVSIHMDAEENKNTHNGVSIFIPKDGNVYLKESKLLGSAIVESFKSNEHLPVSDYLQQLERGIWVLKANQFPAVLIEAGFLTTQTDFDYVIQPKNQQAIAENILNGVEKYAEQNLLNKSNRISGARDTIPQSPLPGNSNLISKAIFVVDGKVVSNEKAKAIDPANIQSINVLKGESAVKKYGEKGKNGVIEITEKNGASTNVVTLKDVTVKEVPVLPNAVTSPLYFVDGKETSKTEIDHIIATSIDAIYVLKGENAINKYGQKGKNGVIEIITKPFLNTQKDTIPDKVFMKVENEASFPGGREAWVTYISGKLQSAFDTIKVFTPDNYGTCVVKFIINKDGSVRDVEATTMLGTQLGEIAVNAIRNGPKWIPANQNDQAVASYRLQPVTLTKPK